MCNHEVAVASDDYGEARVRSGGHIARGSEMADAQVVAAEAVLVALADPIRRYILDLLAAEGPATATVLAAGLPVSRQAVIKHLVMLDRGGLVSVQRRGREMRYRIQPRPLAETAGWLAAVAARWERLAAASGDDVLGPEPAEGQRAED